MASLRGQRWWVELALMGAVGAWALNFSAVRFGVTHGVSPLVYASSRYAVASMILSAAAFARRHYTRLLRKDFLIVCAVAFVGVAGNRVAFTYAVRLTSASTVALVFGSAPVMIALLSRMTDDIRLSARGWLAACVSLLGVMLVVDGESGTIPRHGVGILLALCATATWSIYTVALVPLVQKYSSVYINAVVSSIGGAGLLIVAFAYSGLIAYLLASTIWLVAIRRMGANRSAIYANLEPFLGAVFAVALLSEPLTVPEIAGGLAIAIAILLARGSVATDAAFDKHFATGAAGAASVASE